MRNRRARWLGALGVAVLLGGMLVVAGGPGITLADDDQGKNPFKQILMKLDDILEKLNSGGQQDNYTLRWDQNLSVAQRFVSLAAFNNDAVLDKNTGLVWEQAPNTTTRTWLQATNYCINKNVGGTVGWRLPSVVELRSVQDPTLSAPFVPGSVFTGVQLNTYWSATTMAEFPTFAWAVFFGVNSVGNSGKGVNLYAWCVRGGMNADQY